jgi:GH15 family glucan-1,4-alpha-glucosidase
MSDTPANEPRPPLTERAIAAHAVIGDLHTAALVADDGTIDWCCMPRFDAPSLFAEILDRERGGAWQIAPIAQFTSEQQYLPGSNVLQTKFHIHTETGGADGGVVHLTDFMPVGPAREGRSRIYRGVRGVRGEVPIVVTWAPRFHYGEREPLMLPRRHGVLATDRQAHAVSISGPENVRWELQGATARATLTIAEGESAWFVLAFDEDEVLPVATHDPETNMEETVRWWDAWLKQMHYTGAYRKEVERSALALKLCSYEPTGAILAAPTTSLPESLAGGRTWDYRFTWLRDSAFVLYALDALGFEGETDAFLRFLKRVCRLEGDAPMQIMFALDGGRELPERTIPHLRGYHGAGPVRVGNGAVGQFQLDIYGEVLATAATWLRGREPTEGLWKVLRDLVNWTAAHWREADFGIWEPRHGVRQHVFSKMMAWVALDRGVTIAERIGCDDDAKLWRQAAADVHAEVLEQGWDPVRQTFVQCYGEPQLDAALLAGPLLHFLEPTDPRVHTTLAAVRKELATSCEELLYRYRTPDGLPGEEGAFVICSFWMIQNLALVGELDEAERLFRNLVRRANPVGLLAEEIDPQTGEHLGNFPLGLSHAALINTAFILEQVRAGRVVPQT